MHILPILLVLEQFLIILASNIILVKFLLQKLHWSLANIVTRENLQPTGMLTTVGYWLHIMAPAAG
jgi:hypothetical protein